MIRLLMAVLVAGALAWSVAAQADSTRNFVAHLDGDAEVPARTTLAQGQAKLELARDGETLVCKLVASNIENVVAAHIHVGGPDQNGPIVAFLYGPVAPAAGRTNGVLARTELTSASLVGPMAGATLADLMAEVEAGNAYVNVHTNDGEAPGGTGPGDFPGGEIRGTLG